MYENIHLGMFFSWTAADMARAKIMQDVYKNIRLVLSLNCKQLKITREMILTPTLVVVIVVSLNKLSIFISVRFLHDKRHRTN